VKDQWEKFKDFVKNHKALAGILGGLAVVLLYKLFVSRNSTGEESPTYQVASTSLPAAASSVGSGSGGGSDTTTNPALSNEDMLEVIKSMGESNYEYVKQTMDSQNEYLQEFTQSQSDSISAILEGQNQAIEEQGETLNKNLNSQMESLTAMLDRMKLQTPSIPTYASPALTTVSLPGGKTATATLDSKSVPQINVTPYDYKDHTGSVIHVSQNGDWTSSNGTSGTFNAPTGKTTVDTKTGAGTDSNGVKFTKTTYGGKSGHWNNFGEFVYD
jgi:hypothetical protein